MLSRRQFTTLLASLPPALLLSPSAATSAAATATATPSTTASASAAAAPPSPVTAPPPAATSSPPPAPPPFVSLPCPPSRPQCERRVEVQDLKAGSGPAATPGARVTLRWAGRLADRYGWPFQPGDPDAPDLVVDLGVTRLIPGLELALLGLQPGARRRVLIPAELGYVDVADEPLPNAYGDRRRLWATVLNPRRSNRAGDLLIDVQIKKVKLPPTPTPSPVPAPAS